jgi:hypothetical protein
MEDQVRHVRAVDVFNSFLWDFLIIDLRPSDQYETNHIDRAESCPTGSDTTKQFEYHEQKDTVILYDADGEVCNSPPDSATTENQLHAQKIIRRFICSDTVSVWLLQGGFASFEAAYPFMSTRHELYDPYLCYPQEIVPNLFLGSQASAGEIKVQVNVLLCCELCVCGCVMCVCVCVFRFCNGDRKGTCSFARE